MKMSYCEAIPPLYSMNFKLSSNFNIDDWDDIDITDDNEIMIFSRGDNNLSSEDSTDVIESCPDEDCISPSIARVVKDGIMEKGKAMRKKDCGKICNEDVDDILGFLDVPNSTEGLVGAIVAWRVSNGYYALPYGPKSKDRMNNYEFGSVLAEGVNNYVLVRNLANFREVISSTLIADASNPKPIRKMPIKIGPCALGASFWMPIKSINIVSKAPKKNKESSTRILKSSVITPVVTACSTSTADRINNTRTRKRKKPYLNQYNFHAKEPKLSSKFQIGEIDEEAIFNSTRKSTTPGIFQAEKILGEKIVKEGPTCTSIFLIKWKGFGDEDNTWEPEVSRN